MEISGGFPWYGITEFFPQSMDYVDENMAEFIPCGLSIVPEPTEDAAPEPD